MKDRSDDPSHHERTLLPRSYISPTLVVNTLVRLVFLENWTTTRSSMFSQFSPSPSVTDNRVWVAFWRTSTYRALQTLPNAFNYCIPIRGGYGFFYSRSRSVDWTVCSYFGSDIYLMFKHVVLDIHVSYFRKGWWVSCLLVGSQMEGGEVNLHWGGSSMRCELSSY